MSGEWSEPGGLPYLDSKDEKKQHWLDIIKKVQGKPDFFFFVL